MASLFYKQTQKIKESDNIASLPGKLLTEIKKKDEEFVNEVDLLKVKQGMQGLRHKMVDIINRY